LEGISRRWTKEVCRLRIGFEIILSGNSTSGALEESDVFHLAFELGVRSLGQGGGEKVIN